MSIDLRRAVPAGLTTLATTLLLGLVVALIASLTATDLGPLYTPVLLLGGVVGGIVLGRGGGLSRLVAHLGAPLLGGAVAALLLAVILPGVELAWGASPLVWLGALQGGLAVWVVRTVNWRSTVRTPASEWRRITGEPGTSSRPASAAAPPEPPAPDTGGFLRAAAWGTGLSVAITVVGAAVDLPLGIVGSTLGGALAAWRVPAKPTTGLGRYVGVSVLAGFVGMVLVWMLPGGGGFLPVLVLCAGVGAIVGMFRKHTTAGPAATDERAPGPR